MEADALTRLRLLATSRVITAAQALIEAEHRLATACFMDPLPPLEDANSLLEPVRRARVILVESARSSLRLHDTTGSDHYGNTSSWRELRASLEAEENDTG